MTAAEAMEKIEGRRFSAFTNLASDFRTFLHIVGSQPEVESLSAEMQSNEIRVAISSRSNVGVERMIRGNRLRRLPSG